MKAIEKYINSNPLWSQATKKSERSRLRSVQKFVNGQPQELLEHLKGEGANRHTMQKVYYRLAAFVDYLISKGEYDGDRANVFRAYLIAHPRLFRDAYKRRPASISLPEAQRRIAQIPCGTARRKALQILYSGMRWGESQTYKAGECIGKTGRRTVVVPNELENVSYNQSYDTFYNHLKKVALKPHDLRKIFLSHLAIEKGIDPFTLQAIAGWKSLSTATSYIACHDDRVLHVVQKLHKELNLCDKQNSSTPLKP